MSADRPTLVRVRQLRSALLSRCKGKPPMAMVPPHKGTIMWKMHEITNVLLLAFKIVFFHHIYSGDNWLRWSLAWISSLPLGLSPSYLFWWQLMWWVTTDVAVSVCGRSGLWPFRFVAVPVCGRFGLWPFRFVAVSVCGRSGLWPFRFVAVSVCGRFGLWPFRFVAVMTCYLSSDHGDNPWIFPNKVPQMTFPKAFLWTKPLHCDPNSTAGRC